MFYTYIIRSIAHPDQRYIGHTADLRQRLAKHNKDDVPHTAKFRPQRIKNAIAFDDHEKAYAFEAYLKTQRPSHGYITSEAIRKKELETAGLGQ